MSATAPELSIVIPAYNEELRLPVSLAQVSAYIRASGRETEVIVVDDGSTDGTAAVTESFQSEMPFLRMISNGKNRGKSGQRIKSNRSAAQSDERGKHGKHHHPWLCECDEVGHTPVTSQRMGGTKR